MSVKSLGKELSGVEEGQIILLESSAEVAMDISLSAMKTIQQHKKTTCIILSASRPCTNLLMLYQKNKIQTDSVLIIDCVCKVLSESPANVIHVEDVSALTSISLAITESIKKVNGKKIILIDSIRSMLIHNKPNIFAQFIHSLLTKMRLAGVGMILLSVNVDTDKLVRAEIAQLCDKVVKV